MKVRIPTKLLLSILLVPGVLLISCGDFSNKSAKNTEMEKKSAKANKSPVEQRKGKTPIEYDKEYIVDSFVKLAVYTDGVLYKKNRKVNERMVKAIRKIDLEKFKDPQGKDFFKKAVEVVSQLDKMRVSGKYDSTWGMKSGQLQAAVGKIMKYYDIREEHVAHYQNPQLTAFISRLKVFLKKMGMWDTDAFLKVDTDVVERDVVCLNVIKLLSYTFLARNGNTRSDTFERIDQEFVFPISDKTNSLRQQSALDALKRCKGISDTKKLQINVGIAMVRIAGLLHAYEIRAEQIAAAGGGIYKEIVNFMWNNMEKALEDEAKLDKILKEAGGR